MTRPRSKNRITDAVNAVRNAREAHFREEHALTFRHGRRVGLPAATIRAIHDLQKPYPGECARPDSGFSQSVAHVLAAISNGVSPDRVAEFVEAFTKVEPRPISIRAEWRKFRRAVDAAEGMVCAPVWANQPDWEREYVRYVAAREDQWVHEAISACVPHALSETLVHNRTNWHQWKYIREVSNATGIAAEVLVRYLAWGPDLVGLHGPAAQERRTTFWNDVVAWEQHCGFDQADLMRRAGVSLVEAKTSTFDIEALTVLAALREPTAT